MNSEPMTAKEVWDHRDHLGHIKAVDCPSLYIHTYATSIYTNCDNDCNCSYGTYGTEAEWLDSWLADSKFVIV